MPKTQQQRNQEITAAFKKYFGRDAYRSELSYYSKPGRSEKLLPNLLADQKNLLPEFRGKQGGINLPEQPIPTFQDFLKGAGSPYADLYSPENLNAQFDPYFQYQQGGLDTQKLQATNDYNQTLGRLGQQETQATQDVNRGYSQNFNDRGIYGSGIYQQELGRALSDLGTQYGQRRTDLGTAFDRGYGTGEYSSYNQQKRQIEQQQILAKEQAKLGYQNQASNAYFQQYAPVLLDSYQ